MKLLIFFILISQIALGYINIHPANFDKRIDKGGSYQEFTLHNSKSEPIMYRIYTEKDGDTESMVEYMEIYPRSMVLKPGETKKIQMYVEAPDSLKPGEYSAVLGIKELPVFADEKQTKVGVTILTDFRLVLNGYVGDISPKLNLENIKLTESSDIIKLNGDILNSGKLRGRFEIFADEQFLGNLRIMAGEKLSFEDFEFKADKGENFFFPKELIIREYEGKKEVMRIKI